MWKSSRRANEVSIRDKETGAPFFESTSAVTMPSSTADALGSESVLRHGTSIVGKLLVVKGELSGNEALVVEGDVEGSITLPDQRVTIRPNGSIRGSIRARHVILHGRVEGDIQASGQVELFRTASLTGDISTARISIQEGAFLKGKLEIKKPETAVLIATKPSTTVPNSGVAVRIFAGKP